MYIHLRENGGPGGSTSFNIKELYAYSRNPYNEGVHQSCSSSLCLKRQKSFSARLHDLRAQKSLNLRLQSDTLRRSFSSHSTSLFLKPRSTEHDFGKSLFSHDAGICGSSSSTGEFSKQNSSSGLRPALSSASVFAEGGLRQSMNSPRTCSLGQRYANTGRTSRVKSGSPSSGHIFRKRRSISGICSISDMRPSLDPFNAVGQLIQKEARLRMTEWRLSIAKVRSPSSTDSLAEIERSSSEVRYAEAEPSNWSSVEASSSKPDEMSTSFSLGIPGKHEDILANPAKIEAEVSDANSPSPRPASIGHDASEYSHMTRSVTGRVDPISLTADGSQLEPPLILREIFSSWRWDVARRSVRGKSLSKKERSAQMVNARSRGASGEISCTEYPCPVLVRRI